MLNPVPESGNRPEPGRRALRAEMLRALAVGLEAVRVDRVRTRSALVALAISMAVVVCLTTLVERGRAATIRALERAGLQNLYLVAKPATRSGAPSETLTRDDLERLGDVAPVRSAVSLRLERQFLSAQGARPFSAPVYGVSGSLAQVFHVSARSGRLLGDLDVERQTAFCLVGSEVARMAGLPTVLGSILNSGNRSYEVVGELQEVSAEGATVGEIPALDWNRAIVVALGTEPNSVRETRDRYPLDLAVLQLPDGREAERAARALEHLEPQRYGAGGSVRVASPVQTLRQYKQARRTFDRIVWLVGLLAAAAAVLGISNLLSASVAAREKEIGLRRAVGARSRDIVLQFQAEGLILGILGGGLGLILGLAISIATVDRSGPDSSFSLLAFSGLAALCGIIGILTGIRPSLRASRIDPAQALREG